MAKQFLDSSGLNEFWGYIDSSMNSIAEDSSVYYRNALNTAAMMMLASFSGFPVTLNDTNWKYKLSDLSGNIIFGKNQNDQWVFGDTTDDLMDDILSSYNAAAVKSGTYNNRPTNACVGQMYFCTDRQTPESGSDGIPIYCKDSSNGIWIDSLGRTVIANRILSPVYYGSGSVYTDASIAAPVRDYAVGEYTVNVGTSGDYIFFVIPSAISIDNILMNGMDVPMVTSSTQIDAVNYTVYKSVNTYNEGTYILNIE